MNLSTHPRRFMYLATPERFLVSFEALAALDRCTTMHAASEDDSYLRFSMADSAQTAAAVTYFVRMRALEGHAERVLELLLENPRRIEEGEQGNVAFGVHRSTDDPNEFWLYETWVDEDAVSRHESGDAFRRYKEELRPLVDPESVLFGNTKPVKVLGYELPAGA